MRSFLFNIVLCLAVVSTAAGQLLDGEFGDIDFGREMIGRDEFPTVQELRQAAAERKIGFVMMFKLFGDDNNHHLPIWSHRGDRLAFQRSHVDRRSSKLLIFESLSTEQPRLLSGEGGEYDYMFRWGINHPSSFVFARIEPDASDTRLLYSNDGTSLQPLSKASGKFFYPALYERTDGVHWLAYERNGEVVHQAWKGSLANQRAIAGGTAPRWSRDGRRLLLARQAGLSNRLSSFDIVVRHLSKERDTVLSSKKGVVVRSPTWSPDERYAAFFERDARDGAAWRIQVAPTDGSSPAKTVANDVVINADFKSEGPSWEASSERIWCFSNEHQQQEFYPLVAADVKSRQVELVNYPRSATSPNDLAVNPETAVPELAFVAREGLTRDLFIVFLNHF